MSPIAQVALRGGIPLVIIIFVVVVVSFDFLLRRTTAFRKVFYTGSNPKAAAYSGIRVGRRVEVLAW